MLNESYKDIAHHVLIRLGILIRLRWYAIVGQSIAVIIVTWGLNYPIEWQACLVLISLSALLNIILTRSNKNNYRLANAGTFALLGFDILQLSALLFMTGGLTNPFTILLIAPVIVSSASLEKYYTLILGLVAIAAVTFLSFFHWPLPWNPSTPLAIPFTLTLGIWASVICTIGFTTIYVFSIAQETRKLANALTATELVLQREQYLSALDGMAAAAAHELGTPLATIALVSKEMVHGLPDGHEMHEDALLLRAQAERCKKILQKLSNLSNAHEQQHINIPLSALVEDEVMPLRGLGSQISVHVRGEKNDEPVLKHNPGVHYGLGNLIDNAVDFSDQTVVIILAWDARTITIEISDDGPGFPPSVLKKLGEPFISSRKEKSENSKHGLGLGLFIAKTLLERSHGELLFTNKVTARLSRFAQQHKQGAFIRLQWKRSAIEHKTKPHAPETNEKR